MTCDCGAPLRTDNRSGLCKKCWQREYRLRRRRRLEGQPRGVKGTPMSDRDCSLGCGNLLASTNRSGVCSECQVNGEYANRRRLDQQTAEYGMWMRAKHRAAKTGLSFTISVEDIVIPELCPYLNVRLERCTGGACDTSPSLDRIDPTRGYVRGNVQVISAKANRMKNNATEDQLRAFCTAYLESQGCRTICDEEAS